MPIAPKVWSSPYQTSMSGPPGGGHVCVVRSPSSEVEKFPALSRELTRKWYCVPQLRDGRNMRWVVTSVGSATVCP